MRHDFTLMALILAASALQAAPSFSAPSSSAPNLSETQKKAREATDEYVEARLRRYKDIQRLRKDLRFMSEVLDRELVSPGKTDLDSLSRGGLARIDEMRRSGNIHPKLAPTLDRLEKLYRELPTKTWAEHYPKSLVKAIANELRWAADEAKDEADLLRMLDENLVVPDDIEALGFLKRDVPIKVFVKQGPIKVFIAKHRLKRDGAHIKTDAAALVAGRHNVQLGVELEGKVTRHTRLQVDGDYTFDFGALHIELTPEWRIFHPGIPRPKTGDTVRIKGWTYYDYFHKNEEEYDPEDPVLGINRASVWEVHPVLDIEVLSSDGKF